MNKKTSIIIVIVFGIIAIAAFSITLRTGKEATNFDFNAPKRSVPLATAEVVSGDYTLRVTDQQPGEQVTVEYVRLEKPGFVVLRDELFGEPGIVVGVSELLPEGESSDVTIETTRASTNDAVLYAILYVDDGDESFHQLDDSQTADEKGEKVMPRFLMKSTAETEL